MKLCRWGSNSLLLRHIGEGLNLQYSSYFAVEVVHAFNRLTCAPHRFSPEVILFAGELREDCIVCNIAVSAGVLQLFNTKLCIVM